MSDTLRRHTIRLASTFPAGSIERKALLGVLAAGQHSGRKAKEKYPWEDCIADMEADPDVDDPAAVCGKIKAQSQGLGKYKKAAVDLPSEESGGKPGYDDDFKAGFAAGKAAYKKNDQVSASDGEKAYKRVSSKHGSWWKDGYSAAIDMARGAYATKGAQIAKKMKLAAFTVPREGYRVQGVGKPLKGTVEEEIGPFWAGGTFVLARRDTSGMRGQQDPFMYCVVDRRGVMTHFFGTVPRAGYARSFYEKHNLGLQPGGQLADDIKEVVEDFQKRSPHWIR